MTGAVQISVSGTAECVKQTFLFLVLMSRYQHHLIKYVLWNSRYEDIMSIYFSQLGNYQNGLEDSLDDLL